MDGWLAASLSIVKAAAAPHEFSPGARTDQFLCWHFIPSEALPFQIDSCK